MQEYSILRMCLTKSQNFQKVYEINTYLKELEKSVNGERNAGFLLRAAGRR